MLRSMTAFARREQPSAWGTMIWELRSVNHRYLETAVRLPEALRGLESLVRERVGATLRNALEPRSAAARWNAPSSCKPPARL